MKIFNNPHITKAMKIYNKANNKTAENTKGINKPSDKLELSDKAKEFQIAMRAFKNLPEVREEKVKELKGKIQQGTYNVSGKEIADKMIDSLLIDKKI